MSASLTIRPIGPDEVDLFLSFADPSPLGLKPPRKMYLDGLNKWYRPEWSWVALRDGKVVARVAFSGEPGAERPVAMGSLEIGTGPDRVETGVALVRVAYGALGGVGTSHDDRPSYRQFLPVDWPDDADMRAAVEDRRTVARLAGLSFLVDRLELRWVPDTGLSPRPGRLTFRPVRDDAELFAVVRSTFSGTLDAHARRDIDRLGMDAAVSAFVANWPQPRNLWRLADNRSGSCVGITVPTRGPWGPDVAYIGVRPEHRGNGYVDDQLLEASHLLDDGCIDDIGATTDAGNVPMAAAFDRCGYTVVDRLMVYV